MGNCPSLTFSLLAKVFAEGKMFWYHEGFFDRSVETASNDLGFLKASNTNVLYTGGCSLLFKMKENSKCLIFYS